MCRHEPSINHLAVSSVNRSELISGESAPAHHFYGNGLARIRPSVYYLMSQAYLDINHDMDLMGFDYRGLRDSGERWFALLH